MEVKVEGGGGEGAMAEGKVRKGKPILRETFKCFECLFHVTHDSGTRSDQISFLHRLGRRHGRRRRRGRGKKD